MELNKISLVGTTAVVLALTLGAATCPKKDAQPPAGPIPGEGSPPSIDVPAPVDRRPLDLRPDALPERAKAHLPAYDGDPLVMTLPLATAGDVTAEQVFEQVIEPLLRALGVEEGRRRYLMPPTEGVRLSPADFSGLADAVVYEYRTTPELLRPRTRDMLEVFQGEAEPTEAIDGALQMGEGMTFAQFVAGVERLDIQFPFQQVEGDVPIEHTMLLASRWDGHAVRLVHGTVIANYAIGNTVEIQSPQAAAIKALGALDFVDRVTSRRPEDGPHLVLLPYGTDASGRWNLRYAYRMILRGQALGGEGPFQLWLDAETGEILKLVPLFGDVSARGETYDRDPGVGTSVPFFQVDGASGGSYTLQLSGVMNRVDFQEDGFNAQDVSIPEMGGGSTPTFANFDQASINDETQALCGSGTNKAFQQVNFFGSIHRYYRRSLALGIFTPFPTSPWNPRVEVAGYCNANSSMRYGACEGYFNAACPNFWDGNPGITAGNYMNFAHDNTVVAHEIAHNITPRFTSARPSDWCGMPGCAVPVGWWRFHDLADFWADDFESTNCTGGWVAKNQGGVNNRLNCANDDNLVEGGTLPRLHQVAVPFNPGAPGDHFPEHRAISVDPSGYSDGQIGAAALWQVRVGMRSKCRPSGLPQFEVRFARALKNTGFFGSTPPATDLGIYRFLYDLELQLLDQWATSGTPGGPPAFAHNGAHTSNKVTAGMARAGAFLIPSQCLDGDAATSDPTSCPTGENGGDAVIDVDDGDLADDLSINGVDHPEVDFLELGGPAPVFHVWTGPRYRFDMGGGSTFTNPAPCNTQFRVEVSTDPTFPAGPSTVMSGWTAVDVDPGTAGSPECYGTWSPNPGQWSSLQSGGAGTLLNYRVRTRDDADANDRISTEPGNGLYTVPPPYAVITADGQSDY